MQGIANGVAVVTGAASGIGRATVHRFVQEGATVVAADVDVDGGTETVAIAEQEEGADAHFVETDVTDASSIRSLFEWTVAEFGSLDFLHNNAGIEGDRRPITAQDESTWDRVMAVNSKGVWLGLKYGIPHIRETGGSGAIVNTASTAGMAGTPHLSPYCASKHGVVGLTRSAALEYGEHGVRINAVCPGPVDTPMVQRFIDEGNEADADALAADVPMGRAADPSELASAVVWLCSADASYVNGHPLLVDGGRLA